MKQVFDFGQQLLSVGVLLVLTFSIFSSGHRTKGVQLLFGAVVVLLGAVALQLLMVGYKPQWGSEQIPAIQNAVNVMTVLSAVLLLVSIFLESAKRGIVSILMDLLVVCAPLFLYGLLYVSAQSAICFTSGLTLSLLLGWVLCQRAAEVEMKRRTEEIEELQMTLQQEQMRPHFIFNSLSSIRKLCVSDSDLAIEGLDNLAGYLRKNIDALSTVQMIPFEKELEHIEQYVALEKLNPNQTFEVVYDLAIIDFMVPALSIQPLVENAIRYGVRSCVGEAMVILTTERQGEAIRVSVEDNGLGFFGQSAEGEASGQEEHIARGLDNVRQRLESQCGGSLYKNSDENGSRIVVLIPYRRTQS